MDEWDERAALMAWFEAARVGDVATLEAMVGEGMWTEAKSPSDGMTALMISASEGQLAAVELLGGESNVDERDEWGNTALIWAAANGRLDCFEALARAGASLLVKNNSGLSVAGAWERSKKRGQAIFSPFVE